MNRENNCNNNEHRRDSLQLMHLTVCATTGGQFQLSVSPNASVAALKLSLAKKLSLHAERMSLLYMNRLLLHGNLRDNLITCGSQLTLVPNMDTGTMNMTAPSRVMQALKNLTESQIDDFLTGKAPLLLAMKIGEQMMFVQLQLSASSCHYSKWRSAHGVPPNNCCHSKLNAVHIEKPVPVSAPGAVIDSISHLGQGVYSGTFSGTLNPSVHDPTGRPRRDVSTILQILNDLLVASPQFQQSFASVCTSDFCPSQNQNVTDANVEIKPTVDLTNNNNLRDKVQTLQKMMHDRKLRRQEKRGMRAPYQWPNWISSITHGKRQSSRVQFESSLPLDLSSKTDTLAASETTFPSATPMEQETVLV